MRIGVIGFSAQKFNTHKAHEWLLANIRELALTESEVVSGLTDLGVPGIAYRVAQQLGLRTVGFACSQATQYACWPVDEHFIIGDNWGDESSQFIEYIDCLLACGGGKQSMAEIEAFKTVHPGRILRILLPSELQ